MKDFEVLRFIELYAAPPKEFALMAHEDENGQTLSIQTKEKEYWSTEGCCGNYVIFDKTRDENFSELEEQLYLLLKRRDVDRKLGDLYALNDDNKALIARIMDRIKNEK